MPQMSPLKIKRAKSDALHNRRQHDGAQCSAIEIFRHATQFHHAGDDTPCAFEIVSFRDRSGAERLTVIPAEMLVAPANQLARHLAARECDPALLADQHTLLQRLRMAKAKDARITSVPGWHGSQYFRGTKAIAPASDVGEVRFFPSKSVKLGAFLEKGDLDEWKSTIAHYGRFSSFLHLFIALPFAATVMKLAAAQPFGIVLVGESSTGKTLSQKFAASVMGHVTEQGIPSLADTLAAIMEHRLGHRDGFLALDEVGAISGNAQQVQAFLKALSFQAGTARPKARASSYEDSINAINIDAACVVGMTSEKSLAELAKSGGARRLRGEAVRLIEIDVHFKGHHQIFDRLEPDHELRNSDKRRETVDAIERATMENQGIAHRVFLEKLMADPEASEKLRRWQAEFKTKAAHHFSKDSDARIGKAFALTYAADRLASEYGIVDWTPDESLSVMLQCVENALAQADGGSDMRAVAMQSDEELARQFHQKCRDAVVYDMTTRLPKLDHRRKIQEADALILNRESTRGRSLCIKADVFRVWFPDLARRSRLYRYLRKKKIFRPGRNSSTGTRQLLIKELGTRKTAFYVAKAPRPKRKPQRGSADGVKSL